MHMKAIFNLLNSIISIQRILRVLIIKLQTNYITSLNKMQSIKKQFLLVYIYVYINVNNI